VATDSAGNLYVADMDNSTIRKITPAGVVTTLAGSPGLDGSANGSGSSARFDSPYGVATDGAGNVYVADTFNFTIRKITPAGVVTTLAGSAGLYGSADGPGSTARFGVGPKGVATDSAGNVYVADTGNDTIRKITPAGLVTTLAGSATDFYSGSADGIGIAARFNSPAGVATDSAGNLYVADTSNNKIRVGRPALPDAATIDFATGTVLTTRQLSTSPQSATSWQWILIRRPAASAATLSSTSIRSPIFMPDVADFYVFQLTASNGVNTSITTVSLTATEGPPVKPGPRRRAAGH
jgi:streptogramin lyase